MRRGIEVSVSPEDRGRLSGLVADRNTPQKHAARAHIVLLTADGLGTMEIMRQSGQSKPTVGRWQARYADAGVCGPLRDKARPPGRKPLPPDDPQTGQQDHDRAPARGDALERPRHGQGDRHRTSSVQKIWRDHGLKPHLVRQFKLSIDPDFEAKLIDVVGLYLAPPDCALVLSVDEKSQIQALDRTQPSLPLKKGRVGTMMQDYKRHGTTTLFAALNVLNGTVIGRCLPRHRHQEFLRFLETIDDRTDAALEACRGAALKQRRHTHPRKECPDSVPHRGRQDQPQFGTKGSLNTGLNHVNAPEQERDRAGHVHDAQR